MLGIAARRDPAARTCRRSGTTPSARFGKVDIWINNAGMSVPRTTASPSVPVGRSTRSVATNLVGVINGTAVALTGMTAQGSGHVWNMEGFGSGGQKAGWHGRLRRHQARAELLHRVDGQGPEGGAGRRSACSRPASSLTDLLERGLRGPARGSREGQEDLQHPRRPRRDRHPVPRRRRAQQAQERGQGRLADDAEGRRPIREGAVLRKRDLWPTTPIRPPRSERRWPSTPARSTTSAGRRGLRAGGAGGHRLRPPGASRRRSLPTPVRRLAWRRLDRPGRPEQGDLEAAGSRPVRQTCLCSSSPFSRCSRRASCCCRGRCCSVLRGRPIAWWSFAVVLAVGIIAAVAFGDTAPLLAVAAWVRSPSRRTASCSHAALTTSAGGTVRGLCRGHARAPPARR